MNYGTLAAIFMLGFMNISNEILLRRRIKFLEKQLEEEGKKVKE